MSEIPGQSGHALPNLKPPVCAKKRHSSNEVMFAAIAFSPAGITTSKKWSPSPIAAYILEACTDENAVESGLPRPGQ
jgi:hypothetical protein